MTDNELMDFINRQNVINEHHANAVSSILKALNSISEKLEDLESRVKLIEEILSKS